MCSYIVEKIAVLGSAKGGDEWRRIDTAHVYFDHPYDAPLDGLPLLFETADGVVSEPYPQLGRLALGPIRLRRRHALLNGRRPRFLARRKTGRLADRPVILAGERLTD